MTMMNSLDPKRVLEAALLAAREPLAVEQLHQLFDVIDPPPAIA